MRIDIPCPHLPELRSLFDRVGVEARFVGGCVRDTLAGYGPKDFDLASPARPEEIMRVAEDAGHRVIPTGLKHGTVTVVMENEPYEITTLRADVATDGRHAEVEFVTDFRADAERRDFTINAMSAGLDGRLHDYFGGVGDLGSGRLMFVGDPAARITEDYLRILRFFRFRARFGGDEPDGYVDGMAPFAPGLEMISGERIWSEIKKIVIGPSARSAIDDMERIGVLREIGARFDPSLVDEAVSRPEAQSTPPSVLVGVICVDRPALDDISLRWRLSNDEAGAAVDALAVREEIGKGGVSTHELVCMALDGRDRASIIGAATLMGQSHLVSEFPDTLPRLPVAGADLIAAGVKPGPGMGSMLREMDKAWRASHFTLGKGDLMASSTDFDIQKPTERRP
jgi:hypothetical protein